MWRLIIVFLVLLPAAALTALIVGLRSWRGQPIGRARAVDAKHAEKRRIDDAIRQLEEQVNKQERQEPGSPGS